MGYNENFILLRRLVELYKNELMREDDTKSWISEKKTFKYETPNNPILKLELMNKLFYETVQSFPSDLEDKQHIKQPLGTGIPFNDGWMNFILEEYKNINKLGDNTISNCSEAMMKSMGFYNQWKLHGQGAKPFDKVFFRGESECGHNLTPKLWRSGSDYDEEQLTNDFITKAKENPSEYGLNENNIPNDDSFEWLALMQHYDEENGTRLLDVSSSIFTALYFSTINWEGDENGIISKDKDGVIYCFLGMGDFVCVESENKTRNEVLKEMKEYDTTYFVKPSANSERLIYQDGYFLSQYKKDDGKMKSLGGNKLVYFIIPKEAKEQIAFELYAMGYTPNRVVRGEKGEEANKILEKQLDEWTKKQKVK